jgi:hypothetical protein
MATIPRVLLLRTNESASPVCPFMALSGHSRQPSHTSAIGGKADIPQNGALASSAQPLPL